MKIAWFSELPFDGYTRRDHQNMRTEFAWFAAQQSIHYNLQKLQSLPDQSYDIGIIIVPKNLELYQNLDVVSHLKRVCKKYAFMQEGPSWYFQSLLLQQSLWFYNIMINADFVLAHNDCDKEYYEALLETPCFINPTLMIEDNIEILDKSERSGIILGGNLVRWYGGFNSLVVAQTINERIFAPQMGRMDPSELQLNEITHLPYMNWTEWIHTLNKFKYAIHLNPNSIGGTFSLNCAYLGIPCIGNINSNTQRKCFPDLSVYPDDLKTAKVLMKQLTSDHEFYMHCSINSQKLYKENFSESKYLDIWNQILVDINKK
jgi:hypothetical protein